jgi:hypothetical protein
VSVPAFTEELEMRIAIAALMLLHGFAHLPGLVGSWRLAVVEGVPYHTTLFGGRVDVGNAGMRIVGLVWLFAAAAFMVAAVGALLDRSWWAPTAAVVCVVSLALCMSELPAARIGLVVNLTLFVWLAVASRGMIAPSSRAVP